MNEVVRKLVDVENAVGLYLAENALRVWKEDFVDGDSGEVVNIERNEIIIGRGALVTRIDVSTLRENGIKQVLVTDIPLTASNVHKTGLWDVKVKVSTPAGKMKAWNYIATGETPKEVELFMVAFLETNVSGVFEIVKISVLEIDSVIKIYDREISEDAKEKWYKVTYDLIENKFFIIVQARKLTDAIEIVGQKLENIANGYDLIEVKELNIVDVFIPDTRVTFYSLTEI
jgi:hypothetical protein